jgi:flagellin-like protein
LDSEQNIIERSSHIASTKCELQDRKLFKLNSLVNKMIRKIEKRGISPVIATVLLISIALIVVGIIWVWASRSIGDAETKNGVPLDQVCDSISVDVSYSAGTVSVVNRGSTYAINDVILKNDNGDLSNPCGVGPIPPGGSSSGACSGVSGSDIKAIPVLKGDNGDTYNCDEISI